MPASFMKMAGHSVHYTNKLAVSDHLTPFFVLASNEFFRKKDGDGLNWKSDWPFYCRKV